ncbi:MAG: cell division protein ZapA [Bacteroidota bacterium]|nr:cell division protein ZapA [Bacteroidota bacterium]
MKKQVSVTINIGGISFPLKADEDELDLLQLAVKSVNQRLNKYREDFSIPNNNSLMPLVALHFALELLKNEKDTELNNQEIGTQLSVLSDQIENNL